METFLHNYLEMLPRHLRIIWTGAGQWPRQASSVLPALHSSILLPSSLCSLCLSLHSSSFLSCPAPTSFPALLLWYPPSASLWFSSVLLSVFFPLCSLLCSFCLAQMQMLFEWQAVRRAVKPSCTSDPHINSHVQMRAHTQTHAHTPLVKPVSTTIWDSAWRESVAVLLMLSHICNCSYTSLFAETLIHSLIHSFICWPVFQFLRSSILQVSLRDHSLVSGSIAALVVWNEAGAALFWNLLRFRPSSGLLDNYCKHYQIPEGWEQSR